MRMIVLSRKGLKTRRFSRLRAGGSMIETLRNFSFIKVIDLLIFRMKYEIFRKM